LALHGKQNLLFSIFLKYLDFFNAKNAKMADPLSYITSCPIIFTQFKLLQL